jgi:hypothetical protein
MWLSNDYVWCQIKYMRKGHTQLTKYLIDYISSYTSHANTVRRADGGGVDTTRTWEGVYA